MEFETTNKIYYSNAMKYFNSAFGYNPKDCFVRNRELYIGFEILFKNSGGSSRAKYYASCRKDVISYLEKRWLLTNWTSVEIVSRGQIHKYSVEKILVDGHLEYVLVSASENTNKNYKEN